MAICLAAGALVVALPINAFVLSWTHSVEHTIWRESWRVVGDTLVLEAASVQGSGAGMEPSVDARPDGDGYWRYLPKLPPLQRLHLAHSEFAGDYRLCWGDNCERLANLIARDRDATLEIRPCASRELTAQPAEASTTEGRRVAAKEDER